MDTYYAPADRSHENELKIQKELVQAEFLMNSALNSLPIYVFILNKNRQIVFANSAFRENLTEADLERLIGARPGEILNCVHADETEGGCGTTKFCAKCGAVNAILKSQKFESGIEECRINQKSGDALDLLVWANPIEISGEFFTLFAVTDISSQKRRQALERIFFHDILNTAGSLRGFVDLLKSAEPNEVDELLELLTYSVNNLIEEINAQRTLTLAESDELTLNNQIFSSMKLIADVIKNFDGQEISDGKDIGIFDWSQDFQINSDKLIMRRILVNLVKNAVEASRAGQKIRIGCMINNDMMEFKVYNENVIPKEIQLQIFQRSFSTKGNGRGLGTYSVRLLTEKYLKGKVSFTSNKDDGTVFVISLPMN
ncbi:MAG: PAS domain-containing sensor histidine kinase [Ignavibacteriales bacterium]